MSTDKNSLPREQELESAVRAEREYIRRSLREQLEHEPTEEELDEWLREHTESF